MQNRRRLDRKYLTFFSRVIDHKSGKMVGYLADLTTEGALLVSSMPLRVNGTFHLAMDLPQDFANKMQLELQAKPVWTQPDIDPDFFKVGLRLVDMNGEDATLLARLLEEYGCNL